MAACAASGCVTALKKLFPPLSEEKVSIASAIYFPYRNQSVATDYRPKRIPVPSVWRKSGHALGSLNGGIRAGNVVKLRPARAVPVRPGSERKERQCFTPSSATTAK